MKQACDKCGIYCNTHDKSRGIACKDYKKEKKVKQKGEYHGR